MKNLSAKIAQIYYTTFLTLFQQFPPAHNRESTGNTSTSRECSAPDRVQASSMVPLFFEPCVGFAAGSKKISQKGKKYHFGIDGRGSA
ncbi:MAG: hypothetical protein IKI41_02000, partial [Clostridia bacterium]|nr:hypothetical protein [Clostridia bacterium]